MNRRRILIWGWLAVTTGLGAIACGSPTVPTAPTAPTAPTVPPKAAASLRVRLTVSAAASVQDALQAVQVAYGAEAPNVTIIYNFGSSGSLAQQIAQGAPSDIFLSASLKWMDDLETKGQLLEGSRRDLLRNSLVLIVPKGKTTVADFKDLERAAKVAIGEPESVPAGTYAREVLTTLNVFEALRPKLVFGKDVRQVLSYVETGNVDAGLVYATDAIDSDHVQVVATASPDSHAPITYPIAIVEASGDTEAAQAFVDFLASDRAIAIFQRYGFAMAE